MSSEDHKKEEEEKEQMRKIRRKIAEKKYIEEKDHIKKRSFTSFGKLILSDEKSFPKISFTNAKKFQKGFVTTNMITPGPVYEFSNKYQYSNPPEWSLGKGKRPPLNINEKFEYYNNSFEDYKEFDLSKIPKKWDKVHGGAIALDPRIKYEIQENYPGPGRYEPKLNSYKNKAPEYYIGEKGNITSIKNVTGTSEQVGPGKYKVAESAYTSIHQNKPHWSLPESERKGLDLKTWTKHETYYLYSSCGVQVASTKKTAPIKAFTTASKEKQSKVGMFKSHMSNKPTKIRLPHPVI